MPRWIVPCTIVVSLAATGFAQQPRGNRDQDVTGRIRDLSHRTAWMRTHAASALARMGPDAKEAVQPLVLRLLDENEDVRLYSAYALGTINHRPDLCVPPLAKLLKDKDEHVRFAAEWSLGQLANGIAKRAAADLDQATRANLDKLFAQAEVALRAAAARSASLKKVADARLALTRLPDAPGDFQPDPPAPFQDLQSLTEQLESNDRLAQLLAIEQLRRRGASAVPVLLESLKSSQSGFMKPHLASVIAEFGPAAVPALIDELPGADDELRFWIGHSLRSVGPGAKPALPRLIEIIGNSGKSEDVRTIALGVVGAIGSPAKSAVPSLTAIFNNRSESGEIRAAAARALSGIGLGAQSAVPAMIATMADMDAPLGLRLAIAKALPQLDNASQAAIGAYLTLLEAEVKSPMIDAALSALGQYGPAAGASVVPVSAMIELLNVQQRVKACELFGMIGPSAATAIPALIGRLIDLEEAPQVQAAAAVSLGQIGPDAVSECSRHLNHEDYDVRMTIARALVEIGTRAEPAQADLIATLDNNNEADAVRAHAATALGAIGQNARAAVPNLVAVLRDYEQPDRLRAMAAIALGRIEPAADKELQRALADASCSVRVAAAFALYLARPGSDVGLLKLVSALENDDTRPYAVTALKDIGPDAVPILAAVVNDPVKDLGMRVACVEVLGEVCSKPTTPILEALNDEELAEPAYIALRNMGNSALQTILANVGDASTFTPAAQQRMKDLAEELSDGIGGARLEKPVWSAGPGLTNMNYAMRQRPAVVPRRPTVLRPPQPLAPTADPSRTEVAPFYPPETVRPDPSEFAAEMAEDVGPYEVGEERMAADRIADEAASRPRVEESASEEAAAAPEASDEAMAEPALGMEAPAHVELSKPQSNFASMPKKNEDFRTVNVFYGTNRKPDVPLRPGNPNVVWAAVIALCITVAFLIISLLRRPSTGVAAVIVVCTGMIATLEGAIIWRNRPNSPDVDGAAMLYGSEYTDTVRLGVCEVSIPRTHRPGELEAPSFLRAEVHEDPSRHIILQNVQRLDSDNFFGGLKEELAQNGNNILVFVHGYNVSFEDAARRTAQMAHDLDFPGAAAFYSWPSQANWYKYRVDEKNVELSVDQLESFLLDIARRSGADTINLVAHSMGSRALTIALREIEVKSSGGQRRFNQVVLAAPDIDADVFKHRIAPAIVTKANRITLYASSRDLALVASRRFNSGDARAGDAGEELVVIPGIDTIDVSAGDSSLLGHSYYGDSVSVLRDLEQILQGHPADSRQFLERNGRDGLAYWVFEPPAANTASSGANWTR